MNSFGVPLSVIPTHGMVQGGNLVFIDTSMLSGNKSRASIDIQFGDSPAVKCEFDSQIIKHFCKVPPHPIPEPVNVTVYIDNKKYGVNQKYTYTTYGKQDIPILRINASKLQEDIRRVRKLIPPDVLFGVVLKNGDPVGLLGKIFANAVDIDYFCVPKLQDGIELREAGVIAPIMILYLEKPEHIPIMLHYNLEPSATSINWVEQAQRILGKTKKALNVHLWIDTGLGREGVMPYEALPLARLIHESPHLKLKGIATHFCCIDSDDLSHIKIEDQDNVTVAQKYRFDRVIKTLHSEGIGVDAIIHAGASEVVRNELKPLYYNLVRIGSLLFENELGQRTNYVWKTQIQQIKTLPKNWCIDYDCEYFTEEATKVGLISHIPSRDDEVKFYIRGKEVEVLLHHGVDGIIVLDVSDIADIQEGEEVTIHFDPEIYSPLDTKLPVPVTLQEQ